MQDVFSNKEFEFPYDSFRFPGQDTNERILYAAREADIHLYLRLLSLAMGSLAIVTIGFGSMFIDNLLGSFAVIFTLLSIVLSVTFGAIGSWWVYQLWFKSIFLITNRRLIKFIYTTPWNRYNLSLGLDKVVDTGAYSKGYWQAFFKTGTFTARSSAGNRKDKYFYLENIYMPEDLANYINKLLLAYTKQYERLDTFRPFMPFLKGAARKRFMGKYPQFWS